MSDVLQEVERRLRETLEPVHLEIVDDSARHAGHAANVTGGSHLIVTIVAPSFEGKGRVEQHRLVYAALEGMMGSRIHALGLKTVPPSRWND